MANKLFLVCATLAFCVLLTNASIYRTVVELDEGDGTNQIWPFPQGRPQQKCQKEFQQEQQLRGCQKWLRKQIKQSPFGVDEDEELNQSGPQEQQPALQQCCQELRQEEPDCVCPNLKQAARAVSVRGQHGPLKSSQIYRTARNLPELCEVEEVGRCPFMGIPFLPPY